MCTCSSMEALHTQLEVFLNYLLWCLECLDCLVFKQPQPSTCWQSSQVEQRRIGSFPVFLCSRCLSYLLLAHGFFSSLASQLFFFFNKKHFSKNNVPARLESGGKRGGAEPVWAGVVGPVCVHRPLWQCRTGGLPEKASPKYVQHHGELLHLGCWRRHPPWSGGCWGPVLRLRWGRVVIWKGYK